MMAQQQRFVKVTDVNPHLLCVLCGGYYVDATTIIECLHSFCKSCIVRYLETNKYCPICDVQVHKTKPLLNIRPDRTLQAIVNKLVPGLFQKELNCRKDFYKNHLKLAASSGNSAAVAEECPIYLPDEPMLLGIQYINPTDGKGCNKRYLRCPAAITVYHLQKLMRAKFNLNATQTVEFFCDGDPLPDFMSLMDLAYMYNWKRKNPVELGYRLLECQQKRIKLSQEETSPNPATLKPTSQAVENKADCVSQLPLRTEHQPDREVQLQISENGVMSVQSLDSCSTAVTSDTAVLSMNAESQLPSAESQLSNAESQLSSMESKLSSEESQLSKAESKLSGAESKPCSVERQLPSGERQLPSGESQLPKAESQPSSVESKLSGAESKLCNAERQLPSGEGKLSSAVSKPPIVESKPSSAESKTPIVERKTPNVESKPHSMERKTPSVESKPHSMERKTPSVESKPPSVDRKPAPKRSSPFNDVQPEPKKLAMSVDNISFSNHLPITTTGSSSSSGETFVTISAATSLPSVTITTVQSTSTTKSQEPSQEKPNCPPPVTLEELRKEPKPIVNKFKSNVNNNSIRPNHISQIAGYHPVNVPNTSVTVQKVYPGANRDNSHPSRLFKMKDSRTHIKEQEASLSIVRTSEKSEPKPTNHIGPRYKTLQYPVKPWNPTIQRSTIMAMKEAQHANEEKIDPSKAANKTPKFFKQRNMPRFLGNPASGVKPMYQVLSNPEPSGQSPPQSSTSQTSTSQTPNKSNSEVTVMKIDPKTLTPIQVTRPPKSPKLSPPPGLHRLQKFVNNQPKTPESPTLLGGRTQIRNPVSKSSSSFKTNPNPVHGVSLPTSPSLQTNPFMLPPHPSQHMMYSGFPRSFPPVNSNSGRLASESQILRAMSMFCPPNAAYHPSLPPPISMLFNPHHPHHRTNNDKLKYAANEFHKASTTTPSVQRVPPSGPAAKQPPAAHTAVDTKNNSTRHEQPVNNIPKKPQDPEKIGGAREPKDEQTAVPEAKKDQITPVSSAQEVSSVQESPQIKSPASVVPLSNGFPEPPSTTSTATTVAPSKPSVSERKEVAAAQSETAVTTEQPTPADGKNKETTPEDVQMLNR